MDSLWTDFDTLLTRGALGALVLAGAWALVVVVAVALEARTRGRIRIAEHTGCPAAVRLWLLGVFVALFAGVAPAHASDVGASDPGTGPGTAIDAALDGLPLPDRAAGVPAGEPTPVVVRRGDSLWAIARERLPRDAGDRAVAATVAALYARNRHTIGADPDVIEPGQHLVFPDPPTPSEEP